MKSLRIHCLQHVPFEGPGFIGYWAGQHSHTLTFTRFYESCNLPPLETFDWLVVMGGPMGVYDEGLHPWLRQEKAFVASAIGAGKIVVGVCLGSQLIAEALGAKVYPAPKKEIGWYPVFLTDAAARLPIFAGFPASVEVLHWHGDTFDLPQDAVLLMKSRACPNQAYLYNGKVLGLQFHLECTPATLRAMVENGRGELAGGDFIQSEKEILQRADSCGSSNRYLASALDFFVGE